jgi:glutamine synthetase type III
MTTIVESTRTTWYQASLTNHRHGLEVLIFQKLAGVDGSGKRIHRVVLDCPWHVALDKVQDLLNDLDPPIVLQSSGRPFPF